MFVTFLQVPLKTKRGQPGKLDAIAQCLAVAGVNVRALDVDRDGCRVLADDPAAGMRALEAADFKPERWEAYDLVLEDTPGRLAALTDELQRAGVNIESAFGVADHNGGHLFVRVDDPEAAKPVFQAVRNR